MEIETPTPRTWVEYEFINRYFRQLSIQFNGKEVKIEKDAYDFLTTVEMFVALVGIFSNSTMLFVTMLVKRVRSIHGIKFITSINIASIFSLIVVILRSSAIEYESGLQLRDRTTCSVILCLYYLFMSASMYNRASAGVDRYIYITKGLKYHVMITNIVSTKWLAILWTAVMAGAVCLTIFDAEALDDELCKANGFGMKHKVLAMVIIFIVPCIAIVVIYLMIFKRGYSKIKHILMEESVLANLMNAQIERGAYNKRSSAEGATSQLEPAKKIVDALYQGFSKKVDGSKTSTSISRFIKATAKMSSLVPPLSTSSAVGSKDKREMPNLQSVLRPESSDVDDNNNTASESDRMSGIRDSKRNRQPLTIKPGLRGRSRGRGVGWRETANLRKSGSISPYTGAGRLFSRYYRRSRELEEAGNAKTKSYEPESSTDVENSQPPEGARQKRAASFSLQVGDSRRGSVLKRPSNASSKSDDLSDMFSLLENMSRGIEGDLRKWPSKIQNRHCYRVMKLALVVSVVVICNAGLWIPFCVVEFINFAMDNDSIFLHVKSLYVVGLCSFVLDPIVFGYMNIAFRSAVSRKLREILRSSNSPSLQWRGQTQSFITQHDIPQNRASTVLSSQK